MSKQISYRPSDKMSDLICDNYSLLMVMSRFGLSLGFGDKNVEEVCITQGVDCRTFLAVANFLKQKEHHNTVYTDNDFSLPALMEYLKQAHTYFLDFNLPAIRRKLLEVINYAGTNEIGLLILKFFDEYAKEVRRHMEYENRSVFTYVEKLLQGNLPKDYDIATFTNRHQQVENKLKELKNIIIKYYPGKENNNLLNAVLFDIYNCEQDLATHCQVEDYMFVPAVSHLEKRLKQSAPQTPSTPIEEKENEAEVLSQREKEIITCVVKGMTNKAIADKLFLSIHTVITHRRNITRKLQIHSSAGLTIYAIVNKLVSLDEVKEIQ